MSITYAIGYFIAWAIALPVRLVRLVRSLINAIRRQRENTQLP